MTPLCFAKSSSRSNSTAWRVYIGFLHQKGACEFFCTGQSGRTYGDYNLPSTWDEIGSIVFRLANWKDQGVFNIVDILETSTFKEWLNGRGAWFRYWGNPDFFSLSLPLGEESLYLAWKMRMIFPGCAPERSERTKNEDRYILRKISSQVGL